MRLATPIGERRENWLMRGDRVNEIEEWIKLHDSRLEGIARDAELPLGVIQLAAALVLSGLDDDEINPHLSDHLLSMDGQRNPLAGAPRALEEIRALVELNRLDDSGTR